MKHYSFYLVALFQRCPFLGVLHMITSHVFDTYATTAKGKVMHFDVVLDENDQELALVSARQWLKNIGENQAEVSLKNCIYCHSAVAPDHIRDEITQNGFAILKLEGCPT
jgi:hypothetical protein